MKVSTIVIIASAALAATTITVPLVRGLGKRQGSEQDYRALLVQIAARMNAYRAANGGNLPLSLSEIGIQAVCPVHDREITCKVGQFRRPDKYSVAQLQDYRTLVRGFDWQSNAVAFCWDHWDPSNVVSVTYGRGKVIPGTNEGETLKVLGVSLGGQPRLFPAVTPDDELISRWHIENLPEGFIQNRGEKE